MWLAMKGDRPPAKASLRLDIARWLSLEMLLVAEHTGRAAGCES